MGSGLEDVRVPVRLKLSALWASVMFLYVYGDFFGLYRPGALEGVLAGQMGPLGVVTQGVLLGTSVLIAIPSVMVFLSLVLSAGVVRWANVALGITYAVAVAVTLPGAWVFYVFLSILEMLLSVAISVYAWRWPRVRETGVIRSPVVR